MDVFWIMGLAICAAVFFLLGRSRAKPTSAPEKEVEATGVQELIDKIKSDGISTLDQEMKKKRKEAEEEFAGKKKLVQEEMEKKRKAAEKELVKRKEQFENSLKLAARDFILKLKNQLEKELLSNAVQSDLKEVMTDADFLKEIILAMASKFAAKKGKVTQLSLLVPKAQLDKLKKYFLSRAKQRLVDKAKEGKGAELEFTPDAFKYGFKISLKDKNILFDFSLEPLAESLIEFIRPEFQQYFFSK